MNPLQKLKAEGQSYWLDFIRRNILTSGELARMIREDGMRGMTSNPTIFEKAISSGDEYDVAIKKVASFTKSTEELFEILAIQDIQKAADLLKPVYLSSKGTDGFVSLEVNPRLATNTAGTLSDARRLWSKVKRPNLMVKIPGTQEGLPAIEEATALGLNINITLLFSVENYKQVVEAYLRGLEKRVKRGQPIKTINSVASFFVSRVDSSVDKILDELIAQGGPRGQEAMRLLHKAAIANAKKSYAYYEEILRSNRWQKLAGRGANPQRLLWASTGTKDKRLSDVVYIEELIGADTVNTMPPQTADAFKDHGQVRKTLREGLDQAERDLAKLSSLGINLGKITDQLQADGVKSFTKSFDDLMQVVAVKRELLTGEFERAATWNLGNYEAEMASGLRRMEQENWMSRLWTKDAALWKSEPDHQAIIKNSLGWLTVLPTVQDQLDRLSSIAADVKKAKFTHVLLLGMGGSSLAPEVLRLTLGRVAGAPEFAILDSTEPSSVLERAARSKPATTLYIVASKSGSTSEPNAFLAYFYDQVKKVKGPRAGENFIAITDPGTMMERIAKEKNFRHIVLNPSDIGGRYSAMSFFGMVPAAIMGLNVAQLLDRASRMAAVCSTRLPLDRNPGAKLGAALGALANRGRDKVTFVLSKDIQSFGGWAEQLIAESTGKEDKGILPVESEELLSPDSYGNDRVFVSLRTAASKDSISDKKLKTLEKAGHPVIRITMADKADITAEFFRWEIATAVAGKFLGINPFDQPNVQEAKDLTKSYIEAFKKDGALKGDAPKFETPDMTVFSTNGHTDVPSAAQPSLEASLSKLIKDVHPGDYVAILAYLRRDAANLAKLQAIRSAIQKLTRAATTVGFGPRFLHSTGQLHKGGANNGVFLQITANDPKDVPIPGEPFTYHVLKDAQALGDYAALKNRGRRVLRIHLAHPDKGLSLLGKTIQHIAE
jgi:transaldolase/glucose-6-phosphate isomerase